MFVVLGGVLVLLRPRWAWVHLPAVMWGAAIEIGGWICPLTPLENALREHGGGAGYEGGFISHYLLPVVYPEGLTRGVQGALAAGVLAVNGAVYVAILARRRRR